MRSLARASCVLRSGISGRAACAGHSGADGLLPHELPTLHCNQHTSSGSSSFQSSGTGSRCPTTTCLPLARAALDCTGLPRRGAQVAKAPGSRNLHSFRSNLDAPSEDEAPNSVAAALAAQPPPPPLPYDSDEGSASGAGEAPFVPPQIDKLIKMIMRHGKKEQARRIVFDAAHAMHNTARAKNPRPELRQRNKEFSS